MAVIRRPAVSFSFCTERQMFDIPRTDDILLAMRTGSPGGQMRFQPTLKKKKEKKKKSCIHL